MEIKYGRKRRGIQRQLKEKINEWLNSIDDDDVRLAATRDTIVTGGSIASMLMGDPVNDYDIYFKTYDTTLAVTKYYVSKFNRAVKLKTASGVVPYKPVVREEKLMNCKGHTEDRITIFMKSAGVAGEAQEEYNYFEAMPKGEAEKFLKSTLEDIAKEGEAYRPVFLSQNAITLSDKVQLIIRFYGSPEEIHSNYDFAHAMCYYDHQEEEIVTTTEALEAMMARNLVYRGSLYPIASIFRAKKFVERGWRINAGQQMKIMWQISELDLTDIAVLRDQLVGVDMAYMYELIEAVSHADHEKINSTYIAEIIDRIFG